MATTILKWFPVPSLHIFNFYFTISSWPIRSYVSSKCSILIFRLSPPKRKHFFFDNLDELGLIFQEIISTLPKFATSKHFDHGESVRVASTNWPTYIFWSLIYPIWLDWFTSKVWEMFLMVIKLELESIFLCMSLKII